MKVVLFRGLSRYGALGRFTDALAAGFIAKGHTPLIVEPQYMSRGWDDAIAQIREAGPIGLMHAFMVAGDYRNAEGKSLCDLTGAPLVVQYVDYPLSHGERFLNTDARAAILTVDKSHIAAVHHALGKDRFAHVGFCPHGGQILQNAEIPTPVAKRPIRMLFCGSYYAPTPPPWQNFPEEFRIIFADAAEIALSEEWLAPHLALERAFAAHGIVPEEIYPAQGCRTIRILAAHVHEWVRQERRNRFFAAARRAKLPLTICGEGYGAAPLDDGFELRGAVSFDDTLKLMQQSQLVISVNANFGEGSHERVFNAMLAGAAVVSDTSEYYRETFNQYEMPCWRWLHLQEDMDALPELLASPRRLAGMSETLRSKAQAEHSWQQRIDTIIAAAGLSPEE